MNDKSMNIEEMSLCLAQIWHTMDLFYPYFELLSEEFSWFNALKKAEYDLRTIEDEYDFYRVVEEMLAVLQDGHIKIIPKQYDFLGFLEMKFKYVEKKYVLSEGGEDIDVPVGSILIEVDGLKTDVYLNKYIGDLVGIQTPLAREQAIINRITIGRIGTKLELKFQTPEGEMKKYIARYNALSSMREKVTESCKGTKRIYISKNYIIEALEDGIMRVKIKSFEDSSMISEYHKMVLPHIIIAQGVIFDIRNNVGGNSQNAYPIIRSITKESVGQLFYLTQLKSIYEMAVSKHVKSMNINLWPESIKKRGEAMNRGKCYLGKKTDDQYLNNINQLFFSENVAAQYTNVGIRNNPKLSMPIVFLINHESGSAVDCVAKMLKNAGVLLLGTRTQGALGSTLWLELLNGWKIQYTYQRVLDENGRDLWNQGVIADIYIEQTIKDLCNSEDTQLKYAIQKIKKEIKQNGY